MTLRTEQLLTQREGFGIATATNAQRAVCRIADGLPLGELAKDPDVLALIGGPDVLAVLPSERGIKSTEVIILAAIRTAKTIVACGVAIRLSQTVDVSKLGPGEVPRISLVSLKLDTSAVAHRLLLETIRASPVLKRLLISETADGIMIRHPSGRPIEIACVAGAKAGGGLVARWSAGVIFDEAPRMSSASDAVVNLSDARTAILGRLLPGAQALYIGSPWAPHGPIYDLVDQHWQKPSEHMVVLRGTGPMLNPTWWTPERCKKLEAQDPIAHCTDVLGEFADPEAGLLNPSAVLRSTRQAPLELPYDRECEYFAAADPAEGSAGGNAWALVIIEVRYESGGMLDYGTWPPYRRVPGPFDPPPKLRVALAREWRGFSPAQCWKEIARACLVYRLTRCTTDQYAASSNVDLARYFSLTLHVDKATGPSKLEDWTNVQTLLHNDRIELSPDPVLRRDLLSVKRRTTQDGSKIVLPRTSDGRHCDLASALCAAIKASEHSPQEFTRVHIPGY